MFKNNKKKLLSLLFITTFTLPVSAYSSGGQSYKDIINKDLDSNYVFLFVERSAAYLDWSSPSKLSVTTLKSQMAKRFNNDASSIGHAQLAWHCNDNGKYIDGATGQTGQHGNEGFNLVKNGWGLSVLDTVFLDGYLETPEEVAERIEIADKKNNFAWLALKTDKDSCMSMSNFIADYNKSGAAKNYGFPVEPTKFEGAGCTSFANACFQKTGAKLPISEAWVRHVKIPKKYMGKLTEELPGTRQLEVAKTKEDENKIPMTEFIFSNVKWAEDNEEHKDFFYYDPELFFESTVNAENQYRRSAGMRLKNPYRTKELDSTQSKSKEISEKWINNLMENNKLIKMDKILSTTGLIIDISK